MNHTHQPQQRPSALRGPAVIFSLFLGAAACSSGGGSGGSAGGGEGAGGATAQTAAPTDIIQIANDNVATWADDAAKKTSFVADSKAVDELAGGKCATTISDPPKGGENGGTPPSGEGESDCGGDFDADKAAKEVKEWFADHLFNKALNDTALTTEKSVVFCLSADDVCGGGGGVSIGGGSTGSGGSGENGGKTGEKSDDKPDEKCIAGVAKVPVCLTVTYYGSKLLKGGLFVGKNPQVTPATFELSPLTFAVTVDLAKLLTAAKMVSEAIGDKLPEEFPSTATGSVSAALVRDAGGKMLTGTVSIDSAVHVGAFDKSDTRFYDVKVAAAKQALNLVLGSENRTVVGAAALSAIDVGVALDMMFGGGDDALCIRKPGEPSGSGCEPNPTPKTKKVGALFAHLAGLTFDVKFTVADDKTKDAISIKGLGLGPASSTASYDDGTKAHALGSVDVNAAANPARKVDIEITYDGKKVTLNALPMLDAVVNHTLAPLAAQLDGDLPKFLLAGHTSVTFNGDAKPTFEFETGSSEPTAVPTKDGGGTPGGEPVVNGDKSSFPHMKVVAGLLTLKAWELGANIADVLVTVKAGMCLTEKQGDAPKTGGDKTDSGDKGSDGDKGDDQHFFSRLLEAACKPAGK